MHDHAVAEQIAHHHDVRITGNVQALGLRQPEYGIAADGCGAVDANGVGDKIGRVQLKIVFVSRGSEAPVL